MSGCTHEDCTNQEKCSLTYQNTYLSFGFDKLGWGVGDKKKSPGRIAPTLCNKLGYDGILFFVPNLLVEIGAFS